MFKVTVVAGSFLILSAGAAGSLSAQSMADCPMHAAHATSDAPAPKAGSSTKPDTSMAGCPMHAEHASADGSAVHGAEVDSRHDHFGMAHESTHHAFRLFADGGAIELRANSDSDAATIGMIRSHLQEIAAQFSAADFSAPAFVHGYPPDGVDRMKRLAASMSYRYESVPGGGRVRITTSGQEALTAVHDFLKFQIVEHRTGDSGAVEADR